MIDNCTFEDSRNHHGSMVDIDFEFHARNVPVSVAESVLDAIDEFKFRVTAPDTTSPKAEKKPVPDPTYEEIEREQEETKVYTSPVVAQSTTSCGSAVQTPIAKKRGKGNKFGIPTSLHTTDRKAYDRLWSRCKAHGITYEQALAMEKTPKAKVPAKKKPVVKPSAQAIAPSNEVKEPPAGTTQDLLDTLPDERPQTNKESGRQNPHTVEAKHRSAADAHEKIRAVIVEKNGPLSPGQHVRHNGPKASPFSGKEGVIKKVASDGQIFVQFGESTTWLMPHIVTVIPQEPAE